MQEKQGSFDWMGFILGLIFLFVGFVALRNPAASLLSLIFYFGFTAIIKGGLGLLGSKKLKDYTYLNTTPFIVISILDIVLGLLILFNIQVSFLSLPVFFGLWFILDSINDLVFGRHLKKINSGLYGMNIFSSIITLILGLMILFNPAQGYFTIVFLIGAYFIFGGFRHILRSIF